MLTTFGYFDLIEQISQQSGAQALPGKVIWSRKIEGSPVNDSNLPMTPSAAANWLAQWLSHSGFGPRHVYLCLGDSQATILIEEKGGNTGKMFRWWFEGSLAEMSGCLAVIYYWLDGQTVEAPPGYPIQQQAREQQLLDIAQAVPLRDRVGAVLRTLGVVLHDLTGVLSYDDRGLRGSRIALMHMAGITDRSTLRRGFHLEMDQLIEVCDFVRELGCSFAEACEGLGLNPPESCLLCQKAYLQ